MLRTWNEKTALGAALVLFASLAFASAACDSDSSDDEPSASTTTASQSGAGGTGGGAGGTTPQGGSGGTTAQGGAGGSVAQGGAGGATAICDDPAALAADALANGHKILNGVTLQSSTPIAQILGDMAGHEGKTLRIEGRINEICAGDGCWAALDNGNGDLIKLKTYDDAVDFKKVTEPGAYAVGEGVFDSGGPFLNIMKHGAMIGKIVCP